MAADVNLGIPKGSAMHYSRRFVVVMRRNPGETGILVAVLDLFSRDRSRNISVRRKATPAFQMGHHIGQPASRLICGGVQVAASRPIIYGDPYASRG